MVSAPSYPAPLGGRFRIEFELARGGMGTVFAAVDESTGNRVALKRLLAGAPSRAAMLFEREFHVLSSLKHPRIIDVYDYGVDAAGPYYTMELLEGADLRELSPLPPAQACRYLRDVASSLALLHARRLLHRDVSPRNVRTLPGGGCKLIDFGALMPFGTSEDLVGTPPAIPPEALSGEPMDQRADLFSLGALAYYLLTGRHAYPARKVKELTEVWQERVVPPSLRAADVPAELDQLVLSMLNLDLLARPLHAGEVIHRLSSIAGLPREGDEHAAKAYFVGAALVERERELERVNRRLVRTRAARGTVVFVDSEPGVGKTRFLGEAALRAQLSGATVLRVDAAAHSERLSTARALFQQLVRLLPHASTRVLAPHAPLLSSVWPGLLDDLELDAPEGGAPREQPSREQALAALPAALEASLHELARRNTLVLAVDNVERADPESAALILALARAARSERLLLLATASARPAAELPAAVRALKDAGTAIRLRDLTEEGAVELVRTAFGDVPHVRRTAMRLYAGTHGNPERCMRLLQRWVGAGVVHYAEGAWNLPLDISAADLALAEGWGSDRLRDCSPAAKRLGATMAILGRPAPLELSFALADSGCSNRDVIAALWELVAADVVVEGPEGYRFVQDAFRVSLVQDLDAACRRELEHRVGEALLSRAGDALELRITAGLHLLRGGDENRGAELIGRAARCIASEDREHARLFARHVEALEAAHAVYVKSGRSKISRLDLLVPLVLAGYEISPAFGACYAGETLEILERALGLSDGKGSPPPADADALLVALQSAPVLEDGEERTEETPDAGTLLGWLIRCVMNLVAAASAAIDHIAQHRYAECLRPFALLGRDHQVAAAYEYCTLVRGMTEDHLALSHAGWLDIQARVPSIGFACNVERRLTLGILYALGVLECQRDDDAALARMTQIEQLGTAQSAAIANQLRFLYHGFRGEIRRAEEYRDRVEAHAVQHGSAWQVEVWSTCTLSAVYSNTRDLAGNKRVVEQLARLKKTHPSLELFWARAVASQLLLTGSFARAAEAYERTLAVGSPRERVGWCAVRAGLARCHNALGKYDEARRVCEETLAFVCDEEDFEYVAMLSIRLEYGRALAGLGEGERAKGLLQGMLDRYAPNKNPSTLGTLHRTFAEIAQAEGDTAAFERHLAEMRAFFLPTKNPALIAQCDQLRNANASGTGFREAQRSVGAFATQLTLAQSVLASCDGAQARKQRVLELVATQAGTREAWLFTRGDRDGFSVVGQLGVGDIPAELRSQVDTLFAEIRDDSNETAFAETPVSSEFAPVRASATAFRLLLLTVDQGAKRLLVGTIAVPAFGGTRNVSHALLEDVAAQLFQAGDLTAVRALD